MTILDTPSASDQPSPRKDFAKGMLYTLLYYISGLALAGLSYLIVGHPYIHAPGLHHWLIFLTFLGGFIWALAATVNYLTGTRTPKLRGIIFTNTVAVVSFVLVLYRILHEERDTVAEEAGDEISMSQNGDTTILYHNENIIYMKVQDSVLLNFIDSARLQDIVDSTGIKLRETQ